MTDAQIVEFLQEHSDFFTTNNIIITVFRTVGWMLVKGITSLIDVCKELYDTTFGLVDITKWSGLEGFLEEFEPLVMAFLFLSITILGFLYMFGKNKKHDLFTSILIFAVVVTSSSYLFQQFNLWSITFKDAVVGESGDTDGTALIRTYLFDLVYMDQQIGLEHLGDQDAPQYAELKEQDLDYVDISEVVDYNRDGLTENAREILKKRLLFQSAGENGLLDVKDGVAWTDFGNTFYYRYTFYFGTYFLSALALLIIYICLAYKNVRIIFEIFVSRILVTLKASDLSGNKKTVVILECIRDGYYALCFTAITLRSYFLFSDYLAGQTEIGGTARAIILLFLAFCVIDGANVMQKITGVDAGLSSMAGKMIAGYHVMRGGVQAVQQARQFHMMKEQRDAMKQMKETASQNGSGKDSTDHHFKNMDESVGGSGDGKDSDQSSHKKGAGQGMDPESGTDTSHRDSMTSSGTDRNHESVSMDNAGEQEGYETFEDGTGSFPEGAAETGSAEERSGDSQAEGQAEQKEDMDQTERGEDPDGIKAGRNPSDDLEQMKRNMEDKGSGSISGNRGKQDKNMFEKWGAKAGQETHPSRQPVSESGQSHSRSMEGKNTRGMHEGTTAGRKEKSGVRHITEEKRGRDRYVGGDGGGEGRKK